MKGRILVLGGTGMLGQAVVSEFEKNSHLTTTFTTRNKKSGIFLDPKDDLSFDNIISHAPNWIINCIGVIKPYINDQDPESTNNAFKVNSEFPLILNQIALRLNARVIQIATDCVYSGSRGSYSESDAHDPVDVYGESKSAGEINSPNFMNLRCSIVGRDYRNDKSLLEWFLGHDRDSKLTGYLDHLWNGITTNAFARICKGIIEDSLFKAGTFHQIPADEVSKAELLEIFQEKFNRQDLIIEKILTGEKIDRTINTIDPDGNRARWMSAGYSQIPTIKELVNELY